MNAQRTVTDEENGELVKEQLARGIKDAIVAGSLSPGERVIEAVWAREFGVAQASVREAINLLITEGFLVKSAGRSARVTRYTQEDVERIYQVRGALEGLAAQLACASQADLAPLEAALARMEAAATGGSVKELIEADLAFHLALADASGNAPLIEMLGRLLRPLFAFVLLRTIERQKTASGWVPSIARHREIINIIREDNPALAGQFVQHLVGRFVASAQAVWWPTSQPKRKRKAS
jgi:DNA-binding GntR family transcriptional regulator